MNARVLAHAVKRCDIAERQLKRAAENLWKAHLAVTFADDIPDEKKADLFEACDSIGGTVNKLRIARGAMRQAWRDDLFGNR